MIAKRVAVARAAFLHRVAYRWELLGRSIFLLMILFILRQLYAKALPAGASQAGFDAGGVLWYLVLTEAILIGCPRIEGTVDAEVKSGALASFLLRPISYVDYHRWRFLGEAAANFPVNLVVGGGLALALAGPPPGELAQLPFMAVAILGGMLVNYQISITLALTAFWIEDSTPFFWVYQKTLFILGGLMIPLDFMPGWMQEVAAVTPFSAILHGPARLCLAFEFDAFGALLARQVGWLVVLGVVTHLVFRWGERRVCIHGG